MRPRKTFMDHQPYIEEQLSLPSTVMKARRILPMSMNDEVGQHI